MSQPVSTASMESPAEIEGSIRRWPRAFIAAMRPHQWTKNLFILAPLLFSKNLFDSAAFTSSLLAFIVFCGLASGLYIFNDWLDIEEDRQHPEKKNRPLSSGQLPLSIALIGSFFLVSTSLGLASQISLSFFGIAALYFVLTLSYCLILKRVLILDCMTIAAGFVLRVVGGAVAIEVVPTHWLIVCAFLLALFLAFAKRRQELLSLSDDAGKHRAVLNEYSIGFIGQVNVALIAATIVCYALYTVAPETIDKFGTDKMIYGTVFVIYGLLRYMALTESPQNGGNPSKVFLRDIPLMITTGAWATYNMLVIYRFI
ncbi:MAG: decaprenyl-phosphate phosphoribosyltransferase [Blastocatellia bacterium]